MPNFTDEDLDRLGEGSLPQKTIEMILDFTDSVNAVNASGVAVKYAGKWVAAYNGKLVDSADNETAIRNILDQKHIPSALTAIRFVQL